MLEPSILESVKKNLGLDADHDVFDHDVTTYINTAFSTLNQLGVGPDVAFNIDGADAEWFDFLPDTPENKNQLGTVKTYIYLRVRLLFDPPASSYALASFEKQLEELEFRLNVDREGRDWADPMPAEVNNCE